MNISDALEALTAGQIMTRPTLEGVTVFRCPADDTLLCVLRSVPESPSVSLWQPTQADVIAEDWQVGDAE